ncbi:MAG: inorganic phosphate transporter [Acidobacteriaceae bacterium]|nr:inorganic phosphate transporter [Acidobacteriaceae bacterium]MBV9293931.1 inorganic phosphate transporter [Acidobacteriaceae bacterium]MBV9763427.1 inorganic phosphate transporter [Acidobacteriaceae bacterium]
MLALGLALSFEFVNGFHDTANAVATVIYTHTLEPVYAVILSGLWNLIGVLTSSGLVAFSVVSLLPVELVLNVGSGAGFAMVFSLLISAIIWNVGTWYLGLPASSSHTLIGSIMGVGLANAMLSSHVFGEGVNWAKAREVFSSLLVSPIMGFFGAAILLLLLKALVRQPALYKSPEGKAPPMWIRGLLMLTCTGVSFFHGSNDGQKGMGLLVLILVGVLPGGFALNPAAGPADIQKIANDARQVEPLLLKHTPQILTTQDATNELSAYLKTTGVASEKTFGALVGRNREVAIELEGRSSFSDLTVDQRKGFRSDIYLLSESIAKLIKQHKISDPAEAKMLSKYQGALQKETKYIPVWVKFAVAIALGCGTMIGWKRIVVTVGEKIGKEHLTYAQGASAEIVAMATIGLADKYGLPVSTTHVLSSGIAGTMAANRSGLQGDTLRNILLAWVLTLPICVLLGAGIFSASLYVILHVFGLS